MDWLKANKGYLVAVGLFLIAGAKALDWITTEQATVLVTLLGGLGVASLHSAQVDIEKKVGALQDDVGYKIGVIQTDLDEVKVGVGSFGRGKIRGDKEAQ